MSKHIPLVYTSEDVRVITTLNNDWDNHSSADLIEIVRSKLNKIFNGECFYCKSKIRNGSYVGEIDHIIYKNKYKSFTFHPHNFALCCKQCNTNKGRKEVLIESKRRSNYSYEEYPLDSSDYSIVHPYFDDYDEHLEIVDNFLITVKDGSPKGENTIKVCKLFRLNLLEDKVKDHILMKRTGVKYLSSASQTESKEIYDDLIKNITKALENDLNPYVELEEVLENKQLVSLCESIGDNYVYNECTLMRKQQFEEILRFKTFINQFVELKKIIKSKKSIFKGIENYLIDESKSYDYFEMLTTFEYFVEFKNQTLADNISIDRRVKTNFVILIDAIDLNENNFRIISHLNNNADFFFEVVSLLKKILKTQKEWDMFLSITEQTKNDVKKLNELGFSRIFENKYLVNINQIFEIENWVLLLAEYNIFSKKDITQFEKDIENIISFYLSRSIFI